MVIMRSLREDCEMNSVCTSSFRELITIGSDGWIRVWDLESIFNAKAEGGGDSASGGGGAAAATAVSSASAPATASAPAPATSGSAQAGEGAQSSQAQPATGSNNGANGPAGSPEGTGMVYYLVSLL